MEVACLFVYYVCKYRILFSNNSNNEMFGDLHTLKKKRDGLKQQDAKMYEQEFKKTKLGW